MLLKSLKNIKNTKYIVEFLILFFNLKLFSGGRKDGRENEFEDQKIYIKRKKIIVKEKLIGILVLPHPGFGTEKRADQGRLKSCGGPLKNYII